VNSKHRHLAVTAVAALAVALAGCSTASSIVKHLSTARPSATASTKQAAAPAAPGALTGKWSGTYSGAYHGTFNLHWVQSGSGLHGRINVSGLGRDIPLNGTINGSHITFGTVGSTKITYTGTVSGSHMSGTYQVNGAGGGPWSASKG
jgi:predicted small secreted protein